MSLSYRVLGQATPSTSNTNLYTVRSGANTIISSILVCNQSSTGGTYQIGVVPNGFALSTNNYIAYNSAVPSNDTMTLTPGISMGSNDAIVVQANNASISFSVFGCEIS
jgi:hypothetical protein